MYFKVERQKNLLKINDSFASLTNVEDDGTLVFEMRYTVAQDEAIKKNTLSVNVDVFSRTVRRKIITDAVKVGSTDTKQLIKNILLDVSTAKATAKAQSSYAMASKKSDITSVINNAAIPTLMSSKPLTDSPLMFKSVLKLVSAGTLKQDNEKKPILQVVSTSTIENMHEHVSSSLEQDNKRLMQDMILRSGVDPSTIAVSDQRVISAARSVDGTVKPSTIQTISTSAIQKLKDSHVLDTKFIDRAQETVDINDQSMQHVVVQQLMNDVEVPVIVKFKPLKIKPTSSETTDVFVRFELIDSSTGLSADSVMMKLDVAKHVRIFNTPLTPPGVSVSKVELMSRANLEIVQVDTTSDSVNVYKKNVYTSVTDVDEYNLIGNFRVKTSDKSLLIPVDVPTHNAIIYRVVPVRKGIESFEFTNAVVKPTRFSEIKSISLSSQIDASGITIEARRLPPAAVSIQLLRKNNTTFESSWTTLTNPVLIDRSMRMSDIYTYNDIAVKSSNIYEYTARIYYRSGTVKEMGTETIEYVRPNPGKVEIKTDNLIVTHDVDPNVSFDVNLKLSDTDMSTLKKLLELAGIKEYFNADVTTQRDQLNGVLAYSVQRIDLSTGQRDDFGIITSTRFSDDDARKINGIDKLKTGRGYRYIISALLRSPETMFDDYRKTVTDTITKKTYTYNPAKFLHPLALTQGVLVSAQGLRSRYAKSPLAHGELGTFAKVDVSFDKQPSLIVDASASRFDIDTNIISWRMHGQTSLVDHFLISMEVHGVKSIIGKAHSSFSSGNCQFIHQLNADTAGEIKYVITPVMNDYMIGSSVTTNSLIVEGT